MALKHKRTQIEDIRRVELVQAAHRVFMTHGLGGLTTARICAEAGMSPGILAYYFKGKEEVLFGMVRYSNRLLMEDVTARLRLARSAWERLLAIIEGNFPADAFNRNTANAWVSVCAAAYTNVQYARLQSIFFRRLDSNLASSFCQVLLPERYRQTALAIGTMIDGLWLRKAAGGEVTRDEAVALVIRQIEALLSDAEIAQLRLVRQVRVQMRAVDEKSGLQIEGAE